MAKVKAQGNSGAFAPKPKKKGLSAKTKMSSHKSSKNYVKPYKGQGK